MVNIRPYVKIKYRPYAYTHMKELKFIHITKTAGTSIENDANRVGIQFGRFHTEYGLWQWHYFFPQKDIALKRKYDWFVVVRCPYERIVSEFHCKYGGIGIDVDSINKCDVQQFNEYVQRRINERVPWGNHYSEQYKYIDSDPDIKIHVLKYENIKEEFDSLMNMYGLNISLTTHANTSYKKFTVDDLSNETIELINSVYANDFKLFGYKTREV